MKNIGNGYVVVVIIDDALNCVLKITGDIHELFVTGKKIERFEAILM